MTARTRILLEWATAAAVTIIVGLCAGQGF